MTSCSCAPAGILPAPPCCTGARPREGEARYSPAISRWWRWIAGSVSFMYSYPNYIPLNAAAVGRIAGAVAAAGVRSRFTAPGGAATSRPVQRLRSMPRSGAISPRLRNPAHENVRPRHVGNAGRRSSSRDERRRRGHALVLSLGDRGGRCADDLRRHRRDVLARRLSAADVGRYRLVAHRHLERDDARLSRHGRCRLRLGRGQRPVRAARRGAGGRRAARARAGAGEPGSLADAIPAHLRHHGRSCRGCLLCADDRGRHQLVYGQPQPRGLAGLRRDGGRADDDLAFRALADLDL